MATITLKNVPKHLHLEIKKRAELHRRSLNNEIIVCLEDAVGLNRPSQSEVLEDARRFRARLGGYLKNTDMQRMKIEGRV